MLVWALLLANFSPALPISLRPRWLQGFNAHRDASYLGDTCDNTADCLVPHSVCKPAGNRAWRQQMFCVCRADYHPLTGYCERDKGLDDAPAANATAPIEEEGSEGGPPDPRPPPPSHPRTRPRPRPRPRPTPPPEEIDPEDFFKNLPIPPPTRPARPRLPKIPPSPPSITVPSSQPTSLDVHPISDKNQLLISQVVQSLAKATGSKAKGAKNPFLKEQESPDYQDFNLPPSLAIASHVGESFSGRLVDPDHHGYDTHDLEQPDESILGPAPTNSGHTPIKYFYDTEPIGPEEMGPQNSGPQRQREGGRMGSSTDPLLNSAVAAISKSEMKDLIQEAAEAAIKKYIAQLLPGMPGTTPPPSLPYFLTEEPPSQPPAPQEPFPNLYKDPSTPNPIPRVIYRGR